MPDQVNDWMEDLLFSCSEDLFRFKGVLAIDGWPDRFIFQVCNLRSLLLSSLLHPALCWHVFGGSATIQHHLMTYSLGLPLRKKGWVGSN